MTEKIDATLLKNCYQPDRHDDIQEVVDDALRLWNELENPEEMIDDV